MLAFASRFKKSAHILFNFLNMAGDEVQLYVLPATNLIILRYSIELRDLRRFGLSPNRQLQKTLKYENHPTRYLSDSYSGSKLILSISEVISFYQRDRTSLNPKLALRLLESSENKEESRRLSHSH